MSPRNEPQLPTTSLEVVVQAAPSAVYAAVRDIAVSLWQVEESDVLAVTPPTSFMHAVRLDDAVSCWLTWDISAAEGEASILRLGHDEADLRMGPAPELEEVIAVLNDRLLTQRSSGWVTP